MAVLILAAGQFVMALWMYGLFGCAFYGAFAAKVIVLNSKRLPRWALPVAGALVLTAVVGASLTSAIWYLATFGKPT